jgi:hypothetical protein
MYVHNNKRITMHSLKDIKIPHFDASKENIIAIPSESGIKPQDEFIKVYMGDCKKLSDSEVLLYSLIRSRSKQEGYSFFTDEHAMEALNWKRTKVHRIYNSLEKKKAIYRNTWRFKKGAVRHIVPYEMATKYFTHFLNTPKVRDVHKQEFYDNFLKIHFPEFKLYLIPYKQHKRVMNNQYACSPENGTSYPQKTPKKMFTTSRKRDFDARPENGTSIVVPKTGHISDNLTDNRTDKENILSDAVAQPPEGAAPAKPIKQLHKELALYVQKQFPFSNEAKIQPMAEYCELKAGGREDKLYYGNKIFAKCILNFLLVAREPHIAQQTRKYIEENDIKTPKR